MSSLKISRHSALNCARETLVPYISVHAGRLFFFRHQQPGHELIPIVHSLMLL